MRLHWVNPGTAEWAKCSTAVAERYLADYAATVIPEPESYVALTSGPGPLTEHDLIAVSGITRASADRQLLAEAYLDGPVENVLGSALNTTFERESIVELGPLASLSGGLGDTLIRILPLLSWFRGATAAVCTVTADLALRLEGHGVRFTTLGIADITKLPPASRSAWGIYYSTQPRVICADLTEMADQILGMPQAKISAEY